MSKWLFALFAVGSVKVCVTAEASKGLSIPTECRALLTKLGVALSNFDSCAIDNSRPFEVCRKCAQVYEKAHNLFYDVINVSGSA